MQVDQDFTQLKYALYARKSTDDPERQVRSIDDQIAECKLLAERIGLNVIGEPIMETRSAKKPNQRPLFTKLLKDLKDGVYDGILAWSPDRLARNMKEGGEIIDMLDENQIKDLKFVTHTFTNDPSGKMLLGIMFVMAKEYSDKLSVDVTRGQHRKLDEGKNHVPKYGYTITKEGFYKPDEENFKLMRQAWEMRIQNNESLETIVEYLQKSGLYRTVKSTGKKITMSVTTLSDVFKDPFYYGILIHGSKTVDLRMAYNFKPVISEEEYNMAQELSYNKKKPYRTKRYTFYPLRALVKCSFCGKNMVIAPSTSRRKVKYLYARCDNPVCPRTTKSIRVRKIFEFVYEFLHDGLNFTEKEYNEYYQGMVKLSDGSRQKLSYELHSKQGVYKNVEKEITEISLNLIKFDPNSTISKNGQHRIQELEGQKESLVKEINDLKAQLEDPEKERLTLEEFLNLSKNAELIVKSGDAIAKDIICRFIFLNLIVDEEKVTHYQLKEPFDTLLKTRKLKVSRGGGN